MLSGRVKVIFRLKRSCYRVLKIRLLKYENIMIYKVQKGEKYPSGITFRKNKFHQNRSKALQIQHLRGFFISVCHRIHQKKSKFRCVIRAGKVKLKKPARIYLKCSTSKRSSPWTSCFKVT
jgi:hypothetical protein